MGELERRPNAWALTPLVVFLLTYLVISIVAGDFYKMPITVAFVISSIVAIAISKGGKLSNRIEQFCRGAANSNIMLMVLIFILAGAFAQTAKAMGAVDATVNLAMSILPGNLLAAGIFLAACFISISVGTSVGTIVALAPVAVGIADKTGMPDALMLGVVVSGAMFGDNLSFISDTTIVATRTQGCQMSDKFKVNIRIALPIAILTGLIGPFAGTQLAFDINLRTFTQIFAGHFCQFAEQHNAVPFSLFFHLAGRFITPGFGSSQRNVGNCATIWHVAYFRVLTQITNENNLVYASAGHVRVS